MRSLTHGPVLTFGHAEHADVRVLDLALDRLGRPSFTLRTAGTSAPVALPLVGAHQALNASAAAAAAMAASVPLDVTAATLPTASLSKWRLELSELADGATLLNDSFNANPDSARAALDALAAVEGGRHIAVLGEMLELGDDSEAEHRAVREYAASRPTWWPRSARLPGRSPTARESGRWLWPATTRLSTGCAATSPPATWCLSRPPARRASTRSPPPSRKRSEPRNQTRCDAVRQNRRTGCEISTLSRATGRRPDASPRCARNWPPGSGRAHLGGSRRTWPRQVSPKCPAPLRQKNWSRTAPSNPASASPNFSKGRRPPSGCG